MGAICRDTYKCLIETVLIRRKRVNCLSMASKQVSQALGEEMNYMGHVCVGKC